MPHRGAVWKRLFLREKGSGLIFTPTNSTGKMLSQPKFKDLVGRLGRHFDQDEREIDGAVHCDSMGPKLRNAFLKHGS